MLQSMSAAYFNDLDHLPFDRTRRRLCQHDPIRFVYKQDGASDENTRGEDGGAGSLRARLNFARDEATKFP